LRQRRVDPVPSNTKRALKTAVVYLLLIPGLIAILFPLYITVANAMKTPQQSGASFFTLPTALYLDNFKTVLQKNNFFTYINNTVTILVCTIPLELLITPLAAYCIQRNIRRKYFKFVYAFTVCGIFVPFQARMIALVQMMSAMSLMNKAGMVFLYLSATAPPAVFLVVAYCKSIGTEIEEAALIDGCKPARTYFSVVFPLMKPVLATLLIKDALFIWNDFLLPLIILNRSRSMWTLQLFQYNFKSQYQFDYNLAFASFLMTMLPIILLYMLIQKHIVAGLTSGSIKG
jgi:raffinose/stachyose/melibiose transport system permease protein